MGTPLDEGTFACTNGGEFIFIPDTNNSGTGFKKVTVVSSPAYSTTITPTQTYTIDIKVRPMAMSKDNKLYWIDKNNFRLYSTTLSGGVPNTLNFDLGDRAGNSGASNNNPIRSIHCSKNTGHCYSVYERWMSTYYELKLLRMP